MADLLECPGRDYWQAVVEGMLPEPPPEGFEGHLSNCTTCQGHLDEVLAHEARVLPLCRQYGDPTRTPADPLLSQVVERLSRVSGVTCGKGPEPLDLYFLRPAEKPGLLGMLGPYEVHEVIGQGGMGVVLKAYEPALHRLVAIKVLAPSLAGSPTAQRRFTREARAAAAVVHDHIVTVYGAHATDGLPYLVMQYVAGESLQQCLDRVGPLEITDAVRIGLQTASGLAAAHAQGLVHRDIKPANLLLEDGLARVRITDFGLARSIDDVGLTQMGVVPGTPEYMSPEQARGEPLDNRTDLFSLGSVLYAMCAGEPPFRGPSTVAVLRKVSDEEPPLLRTLNPAAPDWLIQLIARLLAKSPADRIQTAAEVAGLLEGYLAHLRQPESPAPVLGAPGAAPAGPGEPIMLLFTCSACGTKVRARPDLAGKRVKCPHCGKAVEVPLPSPTPSPPSPTSRRSPFYIWRIALVAILLLLLIGGSLSLLLWHGSFPGPTYQSDVWSVAVSADGTKLAAGAGWYGGLPGEIGIWDLAAQKPLQHFAETSEITSLAFTPDGKLLLSGSWDGNVRVRDWQTRESLATLTMHSPCRIALSSDGNLAAACTESGNVKLIQMPSGMPFALLKEGNVHNFVAAISRDGKRVYAAGGDWQIGGNNRAVGWDVETKQLRCMLIGHQNTILGMAISPTEPLVATASKDGTVRLWNGESGEGLKVLQGHQHSAEAVDFSPDGKTLISGGADGQVIFWDVASGALQRQLPALPSYVRAVRWTPDGKHIVVGGHDRTLKIFDAGTLAEEAPLWSATFALPMDEFVSGRSDEPTENVWLPVVIGGTALLIALTLVAAVVLTLRAKRQDVQPATGIS